MKPMSQLVREHGVRDRPGDHPTARRTAVQQWLQLEAARSLAAALRAAGAEVAPFSWSYDEPQPSRGNSA